MGQENLPQLLQDAIYMPHEEFRKVLTDHPHLFTSEQIRVHDMMHQSRMHLHYDEHDPDDPIDLPHPEDYRAHDLWRYEL